ncbi:MAG: hypothetical protein L6R40_005808 [Gallowayella cf. fulva]|nr:MAG: hypothetical protein L6R40_005808 [Xanthomendoza cf. fulva]
MASSNARIDKHTYLVSTAVLLGACILSVTLRFYIRLWVQKEFSLDDAFLILAVCCLISAVAIMYSVTLDKLYQIQVLSAQLPIALSFGLDIEEISRNPDFLQQTYQYLKWISVNQTLAWCSVVSVKFSFLSLFRRLIDRMPPLITYWWFVVAFNVVAFGYGLSTYFLICPHYNDPGIYECSLPSGVTRLIRHGIAQTAVDIIGDLLILYIPINLIWKVQLKRRQKIPLALSLCLTGVVILVTITRIAGIKINGQIDSVWESYFLIVAAEIGTLLASVFTYRAFFVSHRKGDVNKARRASGAPGRHWYTSKMELIRGVFHPISSWRSKAKGQSTPDEHIEDQHGHFGIGKLPDIPGAQMTGIRTFINGRGKGVDVSYIMRSVGEEELCGPDDRRKGET